MASYLDLDYDDDVLDNREVAACTSRGAATRTEEGTVKVKSRRQFRLIVREPSESAGMVFYEGVGTVTSVGKASDQDVSLADDIAPGVKPRHARIRRSGDAAYTVEPLGETAPVWLRHPPSDEWTPVSDYAVVRDGDLIRLGSSTVLQFAADAPALQLQPAKTALLELMIKLKLPPAPHALSVVNFRKSAVCVGDTMFKVAPGDVGPLAASMALYLRESGFESDAAKVARALAEYEAHAAADAVDTSARHRSRARAEALEDHQETGRPAAPREETRMSDKKDEKQADVTVGQRMKQALAEGARRAPVEMALEEGQAMVMRLLLGGFKGTKGEKAAAKKFLLWFFSTPGGQASIAGAIAAAAPLVAGQLGRSGPAVQMVADEFAARGATVLVKQGAATALSLMRPALRMFMNLFDSVEAADPKEIGAGAADPLFSAVSGAERKTAV